MRDYRAAQEAEETQVMKLQKQMQTQQDMMAQLQQQMDQQKEKADIVDSMVHQNLGVIQNGNFSFNFDVPQQLHQNKWN